MTANYYTKLRIGFVANPLAGIGGPAGLKGSDGADIIAKATERGVTSVVPERVQTCLSALTKHWHNIEFIVPAGPMGSSICVAVGIKHQVLDCVQSMPTKAEDTRRAIMLLQKQGVDLILFAGGDGTARDVLDVINTNQLVLGIPCGVKMHSGVFANNPSSAAALIIKLITGKQVNTKLAEVRDIDESAFRNGVVRAKYYGEMWIPDAANYVQQVKSGGTEVDALILEDIAACVTDNLQDDTVYFIGSGSTTAAIMDSLGLDNTLLGVDAIQAGGIKISDAYEADLFTIATTNRCQIVVTVIGGQGHLFGRGNQQLSPRVIRAVGLNNILVVATKTKLHHLNNRLVLDTGDSALDESLQGFIRVLIGYDEYILCAISAQLKPYFR